VAPGATAALQLGHKHTGTSAKLGKDRGSLTTHLLEKMGGRAHY